MRGFIQILNCNDKLVLINVNHIEEVVESNKDSCNIYLAFNSPNSESQDYYCVNESYYSIKSKIEEAMK